LNSAMSCLKLCPTMIYWFALFFFSIGGSHININVLQHSPFFGRLGWWHLSTISDFWRQSPPRLRRRWPGIYSVRKLVGKDIKQTFGVLQASFYYQVPCYNLI
jgi:hypothetical protein